MFKLRKYLTLACLTFLAVSFISIQAFSLDLKTSSSFVNSEYSRTISMDFKKASLNDVLKIFSQQSGLNFIAATDVADKTVTLYLDQVPVEEALERILSANDLTYEIDHASNIFVVKKITVPSSELITRVYRLKHATVPSSKLNKTIVIKADDDEEDGSSSSSSDETDENTGIVGAIKAVLSENGSIIEDPRTNSLVITDSPQRFTVIEQTIARLDIRTPQILIEVEMLDVSKENIDKLGVKFGNDSIFSFSGSAKDTLLPFNIDDALGNEGVTDPTLTYTTGAMSFEGLQFSIDALRTATDTKSLARPRILTLNNETAQITIKADEVIGVTNNVTTGSTTDTSSVEAERAQTGVFLKVTPQANMYTGEIMMAIEPRVIEAKQSKGAFGSNFRDPEERGTKSILRIKDGDTIVIGGLLRTDELRIDTKVPFMSKIPLIGRAFRHDNDAVSERELIIFITPNILKESKERQSDSYQTKSLIREQNSPPRRTNEINEALSNQELKRR